MTNIALQKIKVIIIIIAVVFLASIGSFLIYSNSAIYSQLSGFVKQFVEFRKFTANVDFSNPRNFSFDVTKVNIDENGAALKGNIKEADIILLTPIKIDPDSKLVSFKEDAIKDRNSKITYQLTSDYKAWYYFDGNNWVKVGNCTTCSNYAIEIEQSIDKFPVMSNGLQVKAFLSSTSGNLILKSVSFYISGTEILTEKDKDSQRQMRIAFARGTLAKKPPQEVCGNNVTEPGEKCDPPASVCSEGGNPGLCSFDCKNCSKQMCINCTNNICERKLGENKQNCPQDCTDLCGNYVCEASENNNSCPSDCPISCDFDGACEGSGENNGNCSDCSGTNDICGNGQCGGNENAQNCPEDCCGIARVCGDGILDTGEECDDGNLTNGDGCDLNCKIEQPICGNGVLEGNEECDDGNQTPGDGCSATCTIEGQGPVCGNGTPEQGEECDDGNQTPGDGCNSQCQQEYCGDNIVQSGLGEECDDGNTTDEDGCSSQCKEEYCGDSIVQIGLLEECDDGNKTDGDGCSRSCISEYCGDNIVQRSLEEECDDGNTTDEDGCSGLCINEYCGDNIIQQGLGEQCDDGNNQNNDGCSNKCEIEAVCGNGILEEGEECDDNNTENGDGCSKQCKIEPGCGNGQLDPGEECDDGNQTPGDGCSETCTIEGGGGPVCGNNVLEQGEECDDGNQTPGDGCSETCQIEPPVCGNYVLEQGEECDDGNTENGDGCSKQCKIEGGGGHVCGNGTIEEPEECDYLALPTGCQQEIEMCKDNCKCKVPICHATPSEQNPYNMLWVDYSAVDGEGANDHTKHEGDIIPIWDADDSGIIDDADCLASQYQCGNNVVEPGEECDDGNQTPGDGCSATCQTEAWDLSNITVSGQCIEGNKIQFTITNTSEPIIGDMAGSSDYRIYRNTVLESTDTFTLAGGDSLVVTVDNVNTDTIRLEADQRPGHPGPTPAFADVACNVGPPVAVDDSASTPRNTPVDIDILNNDYFTDGTPPIAASLVVITIITDSTNGMVTVDSLTGIATYTPNNGYTGSDTFTYKICDIANPTNCATAVVTINVTGGGGGGGAVCGNEVIEEGETCDDGNILSGDGCSNTCQIEVTPICGNGVVEAPEQCDDGNQTPGDGCSATCRREGGGGGGGGGGGTPPPPPPPPPPTPPICGNGVLESGEECDDGNVIDGDGCSAACTAEIPLLVIQPPAPVCGNGVVEADEACDDGNVVSGDGCSAVCAVEPPPVAGAVAITAALCRDYTFAELGPFPALEYYVRETNTVNLPITGIVTTPTGAGIAGLEYSINGGAFSPITPAVAAFSQIFENLPLGSSYSAVVRAIFTDGTTAISAPCNFSFMLGCLGIGGNQFVLYAQQSSVSEFGVIQFNVNKPQTFWVETQCNDYALVRNITTGEVFNLVLDTAQHLWTTDNIIFTQPGNYDLEVEIGNRFGEVKTRQINTVTVVPQPAINIIE